MIAQLGAEGVDCSFVRRVEGARSGFSSIFMDRSGERIIVPRYDLALASAPSERPDMDDVTVVSTDVRWPVAAEIALNTARARNLPAMLDLDVGPREVLEKLLPLATHVVASQDGAAVVTGSANPVISARLLAKRGAQFVAVTAGDQGCFWYSREAQTMHHVKAYKVEAIDTLAAGDVFHAGFAVGLAEGWSPERTIRFASAAAAIKCTRFGGRLGAPNRAEVEAMLGKA